MPGNLSDKVSDEDSQEKEKYDNEYSYRAIEFVKKFFHIRFGNLLLFAIIQIIPAK
jgi:hypothetical protein